MKLDSKRSDRLPRTRLRLKLGMALALSVTALGADAAGLGRINVLSSLGQPLRAEIDLTQVARDDAGTLSAKLASPDAFSQANIDFAPALSSLRFSVQRRANGQPYVLVTSSQLLNEPFLDMLVELTWGSGRLVREYTVLIDPPGLGAASGGVEPGATIVQAQAPTVVTRTTPAAPRPASPSAPAVAAAQSTGSPAVSSGGSGGDYVVQSGDTAMSIARNNKSDGVSLEQMLAALYRDNPQAFNGNIDRLMAGAKMKIPDATTAKSLDAAESRRVIASTSDFSGYRERIARNAAPAPTARAQGQQASGKLSTQVEDTTAPAADAKDRLQLSRPDGTKSAATGGARTGLAGPSADELAAKDRELQETKSRLALLEKNVTDLQQLLQLKSQTLADLQKNGAAPAATSATSATTATTPPPAATPPAAVPSTPSAPPVAAAPAPVTPDATTTAPVAAPVVTPPAPAPEPAKATPKKAAPAPIAEPSFFDGLLDNTLLLVGLLAIILLLIGYGIFHSRRRRKLARFEDSIFVDNSVLHANSVFGTTGGQSVDTANSGFHSNFVPVAGTLPEQNEVDPVAEADVYIAYGRDAQAEEILKEALRADGTRHAVRLKLLEIYAKRGDAKTFETMASELYAATAGQGEDWKQAAALGATVDPLNPLYADVPLHGSGPASVASAPVAPRPVEPARTSNIGHGLGAALGGAAAGMVASGLHMGDSSPTGEASPATATEYLRTDPMPRPDALAATSAPSMDLDFDLGFAKNGIVPLAGPSNPPASPPADTGKSNGLDFDVGGANKPLIDPFTASAFGAGDSSARTAVNLPAFRARAEQEPPASRPDSDGFSASDIFGSSIVADPDMAYTEEPKDPTPVQARTTDFRQVVDSHQFDKTEPLDAFSNINLDLDNGGYESTTVAPDFGTKTDVWQAMATKLDLALAYSDIGDKDGARELLDEVVRNGDATQANRARQLISELG